MRILSAALSAGAQGLLAVSLGGMMLHLLLHTAVRNLFCHARRRRHFPCDGRGAFLSLDIFRCGRAEPDQHRLGAAAGRFKRPLGGG
jgi:hypothetical protein